MNIKSTFNRNFDSAIERAMGCNDESNERLMFKLTPIDESTGKESSRDVWMKNAKLKNNDIGSLKCYEDVIWLLSSGNSNYPLWVNVKKVDEKTINLEFSLRFRHIKTSHNQETGHPPFKVISE